MGTEDGMEGGRVGGKEQGWKRGGREGEMIDIGREGRERARDGGRGGIVRGTEEERKDAWIEAGSQGGRK